MTLLNPRVLVGILVSIVSAFFVLRQVNLGELVDTLGHTNPIWVLLTMIGLVPAMWLKAYRWRLYFPDQHEARKAGLVPALYIGYMVNTIAPLRMGELVRAYLVGHYDHLGVSTAVATIVLEKLFDVGSLIVIFVILAALAPLPDWASAAAIATGLGLAVGVVGTICLIVAEQRVIGLIRFFEKRIPLIDRLHVSHLATSFVDGLRAIQSPRTLVWTIVWSAVLWLGAALTLALGLLAVDITITPAMLFFLLVVTNLGMAVPSAPGYVGVYHALVVVALGAFGVEETTALSAGIVLHAAVFGFFLIGGMLYLWRGRFSLAQLITGARGAQAVH
ncbi:MAG TPA: lysylphosphatidylglycerol synthase transmembrane domain-containing protein [Chloroflexota bacterium]|nr:lysylphosphatidylglycerol synthase transmembrane domain-containing protein [Chloroflexota bacterium]